MIAQQKPGPTMAAAEKDLQDLLDYTRVIAEDRVSGNDMAPFAVTVLATNTTCLVTKNAPRDGHSAVTGIEELKLHLKSCTDDDALKACAIAYEVSVHRPGVRAPAGRRRGQPRPSPGSVPGGLLPVRDRGRNAEVGRRLPAGRPKRHLSLDLRGHYCTVPTTPAWARTVSATDRIPEIDIAAAYDGSASALDALAAGLHATLRDTGFAYVTGHAVPADLVAGLRREATAFFDRPHGGEAGDRHQFTPIAVTWRRTVRSSSLRRWPRCRNRTRANPC